MFYPDDGENCYAGQRRTRISTRRWNRLLGTMFVKGLVSPIESTFSILCGEIKMLSLLATPCARFMAISR
ncbi:MAG: hypothetical protein AAFR02_06755, partial [Pseudomonadota bacterium]